MSASYLTLRDKLARATREVREQIYSTPGLTEGEMHAAYLRTINNWILEYADVGRDLLARIDEIEKATGKFVLAPPAEVFERGTICPEAFDPLQIIDEDQEPDSEDEEGDGVTPMTPAAAEVAELASVSVADGVPVI